MAALHDVMVYLGTHYSQKTELSKSRLTKMVYLADWRSAITRGKQLTNTKWVYNHYGPYVSDIVATARKSRAFDTVLGTNAYGDEKEIIKVREGTTYDELTESDKDILDFVIEKTTSKSWNEFIRLVYSTYPIVTQEKYTELDLVKLAKEYKEDQETFDWGETSTTTAARGADR